MLRWTCPVLSSPKCVEMATINFRLVDAFGGSRSTSPMAPFGAIEAKVAGGRWGSELTGIYPASRG